MQDSYAAERKRQHDGTCNKAAFKRGLNFLAFIQMRFDGKENGRGANRVNHYEINDEATNKISIISSISLLALLVGCWVTSAFIWRF